MFIAGRLSDIGTSVGFPWGFVMKRPRISSNLALPSVFCLGEQFVHRLQILVFAPCRADLNIGRKGRIQTRLAGR